MRDLSISYSEECCVYTQGTTRARIYTMIQRYLWGVESHHTTANSSRITRCRALYNALSSVLFVLAVFLYAAVRVKLKRKA